MWRWMAAGVVVTAISVSVLVSAQQVRASRFKVFTVEVSEAGFNPPTCQISRDNFVQFKNVGRGKIRIVRDGSGGALTFDSGDMKPGAVSNQEHFPHGGTARYYDSARHGSHLTVVLPVWSTEWDEFCDPLPALRPIPAFDCAAKTNCAVMPSVATDR